MQDLLDIGMWNEKIKNTIVANNGSIQNIHSLPENIRNKYKTVWEISMKSLIDMAVDRGRYICQSQSLNLWLENPTYNNLTSMFFHGWNEGLKTGIYYLRRRAAFQAQKFTIEPERKHIENGAIDEEDEICAMCSA
jgi:ribonucleotide reductase alpha subunit